MARTLVYMLLIILFDALESAGSTGQWHLLLENSGVSAMHMAVSHTNKVIIFDRTDYGPSLVKLPGGRCRNDSADLALKQDCWAHSVEYDILSNSIRPLEVLTDTWCSSAAFLSDGSLLQTGGWNDGIQVIRRYRFCSTCDWEEQDTGLQRPRWYASNQILPDNRVIVVGGRAQFNYEFVPGDGAVYNLPFLQRVKDGHSENNLYPFLHLSSDGNLFVFANSESILLDYKTNKVVRQYPRLLGGSRNYPASGSSVMLPLKGSEGFKRVEVMICGGADRTSYQRAGNGEFLMALQTCGRMVITDTDPRWSMEEMPVSRVMGDMLNLPTGEVLIINGAQQGTAGWTHAKQPATSPVIYSPSSSEGNRFSVLASSSIPRMYHSTAILLPDGRILVAGSNPNVGYEFSGVDYPTEVRIEAYSPGYLDQSLAAERPRIDYVSGRGIIKYGSKFTVQVSLQHQQRDYSVKFVLYAPPFATHSFSMNQRALELVSTAIPKTGSSYVCNVQAPPNSVVAPPGFYMLFAISRAGIPSTAAWVQLSQH